jgi:dTMP kinase
MPFSETPNSMRKKGILIVFEGVDGSGKATQARLLIRRLRREGLRVRALDFPRYGRGLFADLVARYLKGEFGPAGAVNPYLASLLYAGDRWQARPELMKWLRAGDVVVCNRYVSANKGHQAGKIPSPSGKKDFLKWLDRLEHEVFQLPHPDLTILLDVPVGTARRLVAQKGARAYVGGRSRDIHEADPRHQRRAAAMYRALARREKGWRTIACAPGGALLSPQAITERVWRVVKDELRLSGKG